MFSSNIHSALAKKYAAEVAAAEPSIPAASPSDLKPTTTAPAPKRAPPKSGKKDMKSLLKGVVVKKKPGTGTVAKRRTEGDETPDKKRKL